MILRTTRLRWRKMFKEVDSLVDYPLSLELVEARGGEGDRSRVAISEMPYSAAVKLRGIMYEHCFTKADTMRRGLSSSDHGALQDLVRACNEEARHPALRGVGMAGHETRVFHAWDPGRGLLESRFSPQPIRGARFVVLRPAWHVNEEFPSEKFTLWSPDLGWSPCSRLDDERLHWEFVG